MSPQDSRFWQKVPPWQAARWSGPYQGKGAAPTPFVVMDPALSPFGNLANFQVMQAAKGQKGGKGKGKGQPLRPPWWKTQAWTCAKCGAEHHNGNMAKCRLCRHKRADSESQQRKAESASEQATTGQPELVMPKALAALLPRSPTFPEAASQDATSGMQVDGEATPPPEDPVLRAARAQLEGKTDAASKQAAASLDKLLLPKREKAALHPKNVLELATKHQRAVEGKHKERTASVAAAKLQCEKEQEAPQRLQDQLEQANRALQAAADLVKVRFGSPEAPEDAERPAGAPSLGLEEFQKKIALGPEAVLGDTEAKYREYQTEQQLKGVAALDKEKWLWVAVTREMVAAAMSDEQQEPRRKAGRTG